MIAPPPRLTGPGKQAQWLNQLRDYVIANVQSYGHGTALDRTTAGSFVRAGGSKFGGGGGRYRWRGEYNASEEYGVGDVVIRGSQESDDTTGATFRAILKDGTIAGTYILVNMPDATGDPPTVPQPGAPGEPNDFNAAGDPIWQTWARGQWPVIAITEEAIPSGDDDDDLDGGCIVLDEADCVTPINGLFKRIKIREIEVCVNNVAYRMLGPFSKPYLPES